MDKLIRILSYRLHTILDFFRHSVIPYGNNKFPHGSFVYENFIGYLKKYLPEFSLRGKRVLDIGTGNMLLHGILFREREKIEHYTFSEPFMYFPLKRNIATTKDELEKNGIDTTPYIQDEKLIDTYFQVNADLCTHLKNIPNESIDIIFSNAVFEHIQIKDLVPTTEAMWRVLKPGGYMIHEVDLRDHQYYFHHNYAFYKYSFTEWDELTKIANYSVFWANRLRSIDFGQAFSKKFTILTSEIFKKEQDQSVDLKKVHPELLKRYSSEQLDEQVLLIICKKEL
jgi:SAM-dependent methyltransferase